MRQQFCKDSKQHAEQTQIQEGITAYAMENSGTGKA
jgi:hypothetical protein